MAGASYPRYLGISDAVYQCLNASGLAGQPPESCLVETYLGDEKGKTLQNYFLYEKIPEIGSIPRESLYTDACEVYTGPAETLPLPNQFDDCHDNNLESQCHIPSFVWSGRSTNKMPVSNLHAWQFSSSVSNSLSIRQQMSRNALASISKVMTETILAINASIDQSFRTGNIHVELFSAEGKSQNTENIRILYEYSDVFLQRARLKIRVFMHISDTF